MSLEELEKEARAIQLRSRVVAEQIKEFWEQRNFDNPELLGSFPILLAVAMKKANMPRSVAELFLFSGMKVAMMEYEELKDDD